MEYEAVIGLEVHVQLKTSSKMFTRAATGFGEPPNTLVDPVVLGLPGALPVLNRSAVELAAKFGLLFGASLPEVCRWDRKNYFYPDSPKNYQLTQQREPISVGGEVEIELPGPARNVMGEHRRIRLNHAHLEEDVGKLTHGERDSLVDYNRAGTPLLEIVTEPDLHSAEEAVALLNSLRMHLAAAGISDCDMEKGQMRCDANVSVRPKGTDMLNKRTEMKNLNSVSGVKNAIEYEIRRQIGVVSKGGAVTQETRRWDADTGMSSTLRSKEDAHDYRYFPCPDLMPVKLDAATRARLQASVPEGIFDRQRRYMQDYGFPYTLTSVLCYDHELTAYFEEALAAYGKNPQALGNYVANDLQRERATAVSEGLLPLAEVKMRPAQVAALVRVIDEGKLTKQLAKDVFPELFRTGREPEAIMQEKGLTAAPAGDLDLEKLCAESIAANPAAADQVRKGSDKALNALKGPVMKATKGRANPSEIDAVLRRLLS